MDELRKDERLFVELCRKRGALSEPTLAQAREAARTKGVSVVEALLAANALSDEDADAVRKELMGLSFTCSECENLDFRELDEPKVKGRRCFECLASGAQTGAQHAPASMSEARTVASPVDARPAAPRADTVGGQATEVGPVTAARTGAAVRPPVGEELAEGVVLGGCRIQRRIGQGGMGRVYKGHHDGLDRDMAVKVIDEKLVAKKGFVEQFLAEARTLAKLDHPNIVRVFNVDTDLTGRHFIVMELLEGGSVESLWRDRDLKLPVDEAVRIAREAAEGLLHAHQAGLIHRDVKPGNLMLAKDGRVKVVDFGLAARTENDVFIATEIAGTPSYMAPEQVDGLRLDARCDQYALGASLFQLVCGRPPFVARRAFEILSAHMNEAPVAPSTLREDLPPWLDAAVLKMLAKRPADRFPSLAEAVAALAPKDDAAPPPPVAASRPPINSAEIIKLEKGLKPRPVAPPAWRPAVAAMVACAVAAALFILIPARDAFGGADLGLGEVPGFVLKLDRTLRAKVASNRAEDYAAALETIDRAIADLKAGPGAATLATLRDGLAANRKALALEADARLSKLVADLLAADRPGAILELADPSSSTLAALGLEARVEAWRASALEVLAKRGEVYVPPGPQGAGFYLDKTEVTNEDWAKAVGSAGLERPASWPAGPLPKTLARKPVTGVTIEQARRYARAVGKRLPTSAEWERAARGDDGRAWPWGHRFEPGRTNVLDGGTGALEDVDARKGDASPCGALGMAGNAMEWVEGLDWPLAAGGAWRSHALSARTFARLKLEGKDDAVGFRCARDREP